MPTITPISDLRNYGNVLEKVSIGSPVYLTRNGRGVYSIRDMEDEENFQKAEAMIQLFCELNAGIRSAEEEGWISEEELRSHIHNRRNERGSI
ncbi:MAG: prevent-host-death protein [Lachnospiraceae bacterium]|nr:prevent-host-death protein [Lachnospiraceae bacterium]